MKKILIRADDLGYSEGVNYGIAKSVKEGIIKSVGVMSNMPTVAHGLKLLEGVDMIDVIPSFFACCNAMMASSFEGIPSSISHAM